MRRCHTRGCLGNLDPVKTAVVRNDNDPDDGLTPEGVENGMTVLRGLAEHRGAEVIETNVAAMPADRRQVHLLIAGPDSRSVEQSGVVLCARAFGTRPVARSEERRVGKERRYGRRAEGRRGDEGWAGGARG